MRYYVTLRLVLANGNGERFERLGFALSKGHFVASAKIEH